MEHAAKWIQKACENLSGGDSAGSAGTAVECSQRLCQSIENTRTQLEIVIFAYALDLDQAGRFEFLDMVREGSGRDFQRGLRLRTAQRAVCFSDALEQFVTAWMARALRMAVRRARDRRGVLAGASAIVSAEIITYGPIIGCYGSAAGLKPNFAQEPFRNE